MSMYCTYLIQVGGHGLFAENVDASLEGFDGMLGVQRGRRSNDYRLKTRGFNHFLERRVNLDSVGLQMLVCPFEIALGRGADAQQIGSGHMVKDIEGMALTHPTNTHDTDVELPRSRGDAVRWGNRHD